MTIGSFFMHYSFDDTAHGFYGRFEGERIYPVHYEESVDKLITDTMRALRAGRNACCTFLRFDGNGSQDLSRIFIDNGHGTYVKWERTPNGFPVHTVTKEVEISKRAIKPLVLEAVRLFFGEEKRA